MGIGPLGRSPFDQGVSKNQGHKNIDPRQYWIPHVKRTPKQEPQISEIPMFLVQPYYHMPDMHLKIVLVVMQADSGLQKLLPSLLFDGCCIGRSGDRSALDMHRAPRIPWFVLPRQGPR